MTLNNSLPKVQRSSGSIDVSNAYQLQEKFDNINKKHSNYYSILQATSQLIERTVGVELKANSKLQGLCKHMHAIIRLETGDLKPINSRQYPISFKLHEIIAKQILEWLAKNQITDQGSNTQWNLPLWVVPKKEIDGSTKGWRTCLDPRLINVALPDHCFPLPLIGEILEKLKGSTIFTKLDLKAGFHQFLLHPDDQHKTAFTWQGKRYMFTTAPFGFKHIPQVFQQVMTKILQDLPFASVYVDDIIIFSNSIHDHLQHVKLVIQRLNEYNLKLNPEKCIFGKPELIVLGHKISKYGIEISVDKLIAVEYWKPPTSGKMIQKQLGFFNYFRNMIPCYSKLMAPLEKLRNCDKIVWNPEYQSIYVKILNILESQNILSYPDFNLPFHIATDASKYGISVVLYQIKNGKNQFIRFASKSLSGSEINYGATQRELLAVVYALKQFRDYIWGTKFTVYTDHQALTYIFSKKKVSSTIMNWMDTIIDFDFNVIHCPGITHVLPDALSRFYDEDPRLIHTDVVFNILDIIPEEMVYDETLNVENDITIQKTI
jgi:hypothetical protein